MALGFVGRRRGFAAAGTAVLILMMSLPLELAARPDRADGQCPPPLPLRSSQWKFKHKRTSWFTTPSGNANHRGQDVLVLSGKAQILAAKFAYGTIDKDLEDEWVDIYVMKSPPCSPWVLLGAARTSDGERDDPPGGFEDEGGLLVYEIPENSRLPEGRYPVLMRVRGDGSTAGLNLWVVKPGTRVVVFDIDGTLTTSDSELGREILEGLQARSYRQNMFEGAVELVTYWSQHGVLPVMLTGRPDMLMQSTRRWLSEMGFPEVVVHTTSELHETLPRSSGVARYKARFLAALLGLDLAILAAYGNASTDIEAYARAGIPPERTFIVGKNAGNEGTQPVESYPMHLEWLKRHPELFRRPDPPQR